MVVLPALSEVIVTSHAPLLSVTQALPSVRSLVGGPASQSSLSRSVSTNSAAAPSLLVRLAVTPSPANGPQSGVSGLPDSVVATSRVRVRTCSSPASLASVSGLIEMRTLTQSLLAAPVATVLPVLRVSVISDIPSPSTSTGMLADAETTVVPAVSELIVTSHSCGEAPAGVVHSPAGDASTKDPGPLSMAPVAV